VRGGPLGSLGVEGGGWGWGLGEIGWKVGFVVSY
jgi:hypothetical protein